MNAFSLAELRDPPAHFWPGYFWVINDTIDESRLIAQLRDMCEHDARSVCLLPEPPSFRPESVNSQLDRPYLEKPWFDLIATLVEECKRLGMNYWLYDEGGWPSGGACGQVYRTRPDAFFQKYWKINDAGQLELCNWSSGTDPYPDLMNAAVTETFLDLTHRQYQRAIGQHFGKTVRFAFTDEPSVGYMFPGILPWTDDFAEQFQHRVGYDITPFIVDLLKPIDADEPASLPAARVDFCDVRSQLFVERFLAPLRQWCRENGLLSGGHMGGEDEPSGNLQHGYGHILRALRTLDLPGIDVIWRQLFPNVRSHVFPKYASSVARQMGQPLVLTESFAVFGFGITPAQMKWVIDQQLVRGATLLVISAYPSSTRDHHMLGVHPYFGPLNPMWKYHTIYHRYVARLAYLLTRGTPTCDIAVYLDVRSFWAGGKTSEQAIAHHDAIADALLSSQRDFDFIDDDALLAATLTDAGLRIGQMSYRTLVIPPTHHMPAAVCDSLARIEAAGIRIVRTDGEIPNDAARTITLDRPQPSLRATVRRWPHGGLIFITNEADIAIDTTLTLDADLAASPASLCIPETGDLTALSVTNGQLSIALAPWGSAAIVFGTPATQPHIPHRRFDETRTLDTAWAVRPIRQHVVGEHDFEVIDLPNIAPIATSLGQWPDAIGPYFCGDVEYRTTFAVSADTAQRPAQLDLGDVRHACEIFINGVSLGTRLWQPFTVDLTGHLIAGENELRVIVTNTLANATNAPDVIATWQRNVETIWPPDALRYDRIGKKFDPDSLPSGLFGPVQLHLNGTPQNAHYR